MRQHTKDVLWFALISAAVVAVCWGIAALVGA